MRAEAELNRWTNKEVSPKGVPYPESKFDNTPGQPFGWATPAAIISGKGWYNPEPWRVTHGDHIVEWAKEKFPDVVIYTYEMNRGRQTILVGLRTGKGKRLEELHEMMCSVWPKKQVRLNDWCISVIDDLQKHVLRDV